MVGLKHNILIILLALLVVEIFFHGIYAYSPSFVRQEIKDGTSDWSLLQQNPEQILITKYGNKKFYFKPTINIKDCKDNDGNFNSADIGAVSYISNGTILNATVWLTSPFEKPIVNDSNIFQPYIRTDALLNNENISLNQFVKTEVANLKTFSKQIVELTNTTIDNNSAYKIVFTYQGGQLEICNACKSMEILTEKDDKIISIFFIAPENIYDNLLPIAKKMIDTIKLNTKIESSKADPQV